MQNPPIERADGHGDRACRRDESVRGRPPLGREVPGDERDDRRQDQSRADALEERPAEEQRRQVLRDRGDERAAAVDHAADRERPLAADDGADLRPGDHQRRHDERVGGDRALDPGDGGADVLRDRCDRDVHHRRVERHQELAGREREQHDHRTARCCGCLFRRRRVGHVDPPAAHVAGTSEPPSSETRGPKRTKAGCEAILPATSDSPMRNDVASRRSAGGANESVSPT